MSQVKLNGAFLSFFHKMEISCSLYSFPQHCHDEPDSSRLAAPDWRIWSQLQIQFQSGADSSPVAFIRAGARPEVGA
jgi:hypothetical protein